MYQAEQRFLSPQWEGVSFCLVLWLRFELRGQAILGCMTAFSIQGPMRLYSSSR